LNGILHGNQGIQRWEILISAHIGQSAELQKQMYLMKEKHENYKVENLAPCLLVRIELVFKMNTVCPSGF
jgi:hypothetical protein